MYSKDSLGHKHKNTILENNFLCTLWGKSEFISHFLQNWDEFIIRPGHSTRKYFRRKLLLVYYQFSSSCPVKQLAKWLILPLLGIFSPLLDYQQRNLNTGIIINNKTRWQTRNHFSNQSPPVYLDKELWDFKETKTPAHHRLHIWVGAGVNDEEKLAHTYRVYT